jgi:adenylate cyclase
MGQSSKPSIQIDLNEFKLHLHLKSRTQLTLQFNSPSRKFYLSVIALVVNEMKKLGKIKSISLQEYLDLLILLNESIGGAAGSSEKENLLHRIYRKWKDALPNLEEAPLFAVLGKKKELGDWAIGKIYSFTDAEKDEWANLFEYMGSEENVRLKFAIDKIGIGLNETSIIFEDSQNGDAWDQFISSLRDGKKEETQPVEESAEPAVPEPPVVPFSTPQERKVSWVSRYRWAALMAAIVVVLGSITLAIWKTYLSPDRHDVASLKRMAFPLPDVPSIAVLPFVNMSGDPKQEFLCDGMTDAIITALTKVPRLFVIARYSTFTYKGKQVKVKQVSEELGVRYVLEGGFQRSGDRVRITGQLIDALTGNHLWAEHYDRDLKDIFALQDEITIKILTATQVKLTGLEESLFRGPKYFKEKQGLDCCLKYYEGLKYFFGYNIEDLRKARQIIEEVIAMCPEVPMAYTLMGFIYYNESAFGLEDPPQRSLEKSMEMAQKALSMDDSLPNAHGLLSSLYLLKRDYDKAIAEGDRAVALNPGEAFAHHWYAASLIYIGRSEEAIPIFQKAIRLNPFGASFLYRALGSALRNTGRFEESVSAFKKAIRIAPDDLPGHIGLTITYSMMGREKNARAEAAEVLRINPKFSVDGWAKNNPTYKDHSTDGKIINALCKAGLK